MAGLINRICLASRFLRFASARPSVRHISALNVTLPNNNVLKNNFQNGNNCVMPALPDPTTISKRCMGHKPPLTYDFAKERIMLVLKLYDKVDPEKLTWDSHFYKDLGLDSLDHVEVIMMMEDEFHFEIPDRDAERLMTPKDLLTYVTDKEEAYEELQHHDDHH